MIGRVGQVLSLEEGVVGGRIPGRWEHDACGLRAGQFCLEGVGDLLRHFTLDSEDILQRARVSVRPQVVVRRGVDQLQINQHLIAGLLHAPFQDRGDAELLTDYFQVVRMTRVFLGRGARNDFEVANAGQLGQNHVLHPAGEVSVVLVTAQIFEGQNSDGFSSNRHRSRLGVGRFGFIAMKDELIRE